MIASRDMESGRSPRRALGAAFLLLALGAPGLAAAQAGGGHPALQDRWSLQLGLYSPKVSTEAFLNSSTLARGTSVSFEDDLNLTDRKALPAILGAVRLGERWRIEAEYFALNRDGSRAINRNINWGNNLYTVGTVVNSSFDSDIFRLSGGYSFVKDNRSELGVALGVHVTDFAASLSAAGIGTQVGDALAPLPTIGLYGAYALDSKWLVNGRLDYFSLKYEDYDGTLVNFNLGVEYRFTRSFGAGLSYRHVNYDVDVTKSSYNGGVQYKFSGPMLYGVMSF